MRFKSWPRPTPFEDTPRKRAAYRRKREREQAALPLFAPAIAERQLCVAEEMVRRTGQWERQQQEGRRQRAASWRRVRARLFALEGARRRAIRALWRVCPYPADPSYFGTLLHEIATGRIDPERPPWGAAHALNPRTTPNPAGFAEAFRQIGQRTVGGGRKTVGADERLFCGNLGSGILFLTTRVRLIEPNESFYTSSSHRLRDSHVGSSGHWADIEVRGPCSDEEFRRITRLARVADTRPVVMRRIDPIAGRPGREIERSAPTVTGADADLPAFQARQFDRDLRPEPNPPSERAPGPMAGDVIGVATMAAKQDAGSCPYPGPSPNPPP
jgi:hypothetical protein